MKNLKIEEISSSGQKQGKNMKIGKFPRELGRPGSYDNTINFMSVLLTNFHYNRTDFLCNYASNFLKQTTE